jgi:probable rRNA maturation factor
MIVRVLVDRDVARQVGRDTRRRLGAIAVRAARRLGMPTEHLRALCVRIVGDAAMIELHRRHLGSAHPTDVLSFESEDPEHPGDIAIDWDQVQRQAAVKSAAGLCAEAEQLVVHGIAHLVGHDHARRADARRMLRAERAAARSASVATPARPYGGAA